MARFVIVAIFYVFCLFNENCFGLRCYDGSGMRKADSLPRDPNMIPPANGSYWNYWNYQNIRSNCTSCRSIIITQEPQFGTDAPTVLMNLVCEQQDTASNTCEIDQNKYFADLKTVTELNPQSKTAQVLANVRAVCQAGPSNILANAQISCSRCTIDFCNLFHFMGSVSCSIGYGLQSLYASIGNCPLGQGCLIEKNLTTDSDLITTNFTDSEFITRASCLKFGCTKAVLDSCIDGCRSSKTNKQCLCWCNGDYRIYDPPILATTTAKPNDYYNYY